MKNNIYICWVIIIAILIGVVAVATYFATSSKSNKIITYSCSADNSQEDVFWEDVHIALSKSIDNSGDDIDMHNEYFTLAKGHYEQTWLASFTGFVDDLQIAYVEKINYYPQSKLLIAYGTKPREEGISEDEWNNDSLLLSPPQYYFIIDLRNGQYLYFKTIDKINNYLSEKGYTINIKLLHPNILFNKLQQSAIPREGPLGTGKFLGTRQ